MDKNGDDGPYGERHVDPTAAILAGEAAGQAVPADRAGTEGSAPFDVWRELPPRDGRGAADDTTYYDRPVLKEPTWIWSVPAYFYAGGAAGASAVLGLVSELADREGLEGLAARCHWISAIGDAAGTALLVEDLGRPERFFNMLRVFRPSSPMNMGSWILSTSAISSVPAVLLRKRRGVLGRIARGGSAFSGVAGLPLSGYTAVLLSNTAVPVWQATRRTLPLVFVASAVSSAASLLDLLPLSDREARIVNRYGLAGKIGELIAVTAMEHDADEVPEVGRPLHDGTGGRLWRAAKTLTAASAALSLMPGRSQAKRRLSGVLGTLGALALRFAVFEAGRASAADPRATFRQQRSGHGAAEVTGAAAVTGPGGRRALS